MKYFIAVMFVGLFIGVAKAEEYVVTKASDTVVTITKTTVNGDTTSIQKRDIAASAEIASIDKVIADLDGQIVQIEAQKVKLEEKKAAVLAALEPKE